MALHQRGKVQRLKTERAEITIIPERRGGYTWAVFAQDGRCASRGYAESASEAKKEAKSAADQV